MPVIVIEVILIFGGVLLFGWWQLRDLDREKRRRESAAKNPVNSPAPEQETRP